eukprot:1159344-Pelagomonas_calceolata.AAC.15
MTTVHVMTQPIICTILLMHTAAHRPLSPLALLQRYDYKDHIALYDVHSWKEVLHITCDTSDAVDLRWSPDGTYIAVWDSVLTYRYAPALHLNTHVT